jgi:hypothetical protein
MDTFLIWSEEHRAWWRPYARGYTDSIVQAGRYTADRAAQIVRDGNIGGRFHEIAIPVPAGIPERGDDRR